MYACTGSDLLKFHKYVYIPLRSIYFFSELCIMKFHWLCTSLFFIFPYPFCFVTAFLITLFFLFYRGSNCGRSQSYLLSKLELLPTCQQNAWCFLVEPIYFCFGCNQHFNISMVVDNKSRGTCTGAQTPASD